jgi:hypothetical protein
VRTQGIDVRRPESAQNAVERRRRALEEKGASSNSAVTAYSDVSFEHRLPGQADLEKALKCLPVSTTLLAYQPLRNHLVIWCYEPESGLKLYMRPFRFNETA